MGKIISISGTHSVGKTSLLEGLKKDVIFKNFKFIEGVTRQIKKKGFEINNTFNDYNESQLLIANTHFQNIINFKENENIISDRSIFDVYVYTHYLYCKLKINTWVYLYVKNLYEFYLKKFTYIIYIEPVIDLKKDGVRIKDENFRNDIVLIFEKELKRIVIPIYRIKTKIFEERIQLIKKIIN